MPLALAAPVVTLAIGVSIGYALKRPVETEVIPPFSSGSAGRDLLSGLCTQNETYAKLTQVDRLVDPHTQKIFRLESLQAKAYSDRGIICMVDGTLRTLNERSPGFNMIDEKIHQIILVSITGESEVASVEFIKALLSSRAVRAMSSNVGNDGTVTPKVKVKIAGLGIN
ncbi:hypothetical protein [Pseudomonas baetica]|uniref:hypothetical protein n=1 Tax=Pseudomonas baetica TaxID=674054 RepID=UPI0024069386|nr:hypothetical protein [Pseudomonas baetica]MDF9779254.1 hypothetical protein [Pseudomonas baetica]